MNTLLINPGTIRIRGLERENSFPLGLGYIAAVLDASHKVKVIDVRAEKLGDDSLREAISKIAPRIVGITSMTIAFSRAIEIAQMVKQINNDTVVVVGGAHSNVWPDYPLKYDCFDISVYGEGERTAIELWDKIERGESYEDIKGIAFRKDGEVIVNQRREFIVNLDELPFPARHLFPMSKYQDESNLYVSPVCSIGTSRGCPFSCAFCSSNVSFGRRYRFRSPKNVVDEIELLINEYNARGIYFREDLFTVNAKKVIATCDEIKKRGLNFKWECESRVDTVNEEMLRAMKSAGCEYIWFGVESASQEMLDYLNKQITISQVKEAYNLCKKIGIRAGASFLIGVPGETIGDIYSTINFAGELNAESAQFNIFTGHPTSPLYEYVRENNLYGEDVGHGLLMVKTSEFEREQLEKIQKYAQGKVNWGVKKLFRRALLEIGGKSITWQKVRKGLKYLGSAKKPM